MLPPSTYLAATMRQDKLACLAAASCLASCSARFLRYAAVAEGRLPFFFLGLRPPFLVLLAGAAAAAGGGEEDGGCAAFADVALVAVARALLVVAATAAAAAGRVAGEADVLLLLLLLGMMVEEAGRLAPSTSILPPAAPRRNQDCSMPVVSGYVGKGVDGGSVRWARTRGMDGRKDP